MNEAYQVLSETEQGRQKIRDIKVMLLQGPRTYTLVKVIADDGLYGIGEAYGSCLLYTSPSPRDATLSRMPSSA